MTGEINAHASQREYARSRWQMRLLVNYGALTTCATTLENGPLSLDIETNLAVSSAIRALVPCISTARELAPPVRHYRF